MRIVVRLPWEALKAEQLDLFGGPPTPVGPKPKKGAAVPGVPRSGLHAEKVHVGGAHPHEQTVWKAEAKPVAAPQAPPHAPEVAEHVRHHSDAQIGVKRAIEAVGAAYPNARDYPPGIAPGAHEKATAQIQGWRNSLDGALKATVAGRMAAKTRAGVAGPAGYEPPPLPPTSPMGKPDSNDTGEHLAKHGIIAPHVDHNTDKAGLHSRYLDAAHAVGEAARHMRRAQASAPNPEEYGAHAGALEGIHGHLKALAAHTHPAAQPHHEHERLRKEALGEFERAEEHHSELARTHPSAEGRRLHGLAKEFNAHARREVAGLRAGTADFKHQVDGHISHSRAHATNIHRNDIAEEQAQRAAPKPVWTMGPGQYTAMAGVERPGIGEISGVQRARMSKAAVDRFDADRRKRSEAHGAAVNDYESAVMSAADRGEVDMNHPDLHPQARDLIKSVRSRRSVDAVKQAGAGVHSAYYAAQASSPFDLAVGHKVRTPFGVTGVVSKVFQKSVQITDKDGNIHKEDKQHVGLQHAEAQKHAMESASDEDLRLIATHGANFPGGREQSGRFEWREEAAAELARRRGAK